jgi:TonB family protein
MKKIQLILTVVIIMTSIVLFAHPPKDSTISFNNTTKILNVNVPHKIKKPRVHYVEKIEVYLNNRLKIVQYFHQQMNKTEQKAKFLLTEAVGEDKIEVKIFCKLFGDVSKTLIVEGKAPAFSKASIENEVADVVIGQTPRFAPFEEAPIAVKQIQAIYPESAKSSGTEGEVWVDVEVLANGKVGAVEIKRSLMSGKGGLDEAAIETVKRWEFKPAKNNGKPVACWVTFAVSF